ncbi:MAG TPA: BACON domain-containing carbohydrate-binding protein [Bryobacteraceae bacterium]|nr:BACON domain-containing carbohydrate-binding protein [Bryobacteraceae bacterium]
MPSSRFLTARICLILVTSVFLSMPAFAVVADTLTASENPVNFFYNGSPLDVLPKTIAISKGGEAVTITTATFTTNPIGYNYSPIFQASISGSSVNLGINSGALLGLASGTLPGVLHIEAGADVLNLPVKLIVGATGGITLSTTTLPFSAPLGGTQTQTQLIRVMSASGVQMSYTAAATMNSGLGWLAIQSGATGVSNTANDTITVQVVPAGLAAGDYTGTITVTPSGGFAAQTVNVTLTVGGSLVLSPSALTFSYNGGLLPETRTISVSSISTVPSYTQFYARNSGESWLLVNGQTATTSWVTLPGNIQISVAPTQLSSGVHYGTVVIIASDGQNTAQTNMPVTLTVNSGTTQVAVNPSSLTMTAPAGGSDFKQIQLSTTAAGVSFLATTSAPWLTLSATSGQVPSAGVQTYAIANAAALRAGYYEGWVYLTFYGALSETRSIPVSFTVGGSGGIGTSGVNPSQLSFYMDEGSMAERPRQEFALTGVAGTEFTATAATTTGGNWLQVTDGSKGVIPAKIQVGINSSVAAGLASGNYTGSITVTTSAGTYTVGVTLSIVSGTVLGVNISTLGNLTVFYEPETVIPAQYVQVWSTKGTPITYSVSTGTSWITLVNPPVGGTISTGPSAFYFIVAAGNLPAGVHLGSINITASGSTYSSISIPVTVVVTGSPTPIATPATLSFSTAPGGAPTAQNLEINAAGGAVFTATANSSGGWLTVSPASGATPATVAVSVNAASLTTGTYQGTIALASGSTSQTVNVTLTVTTASAVALTVTGDDLTFNYQKGGTAPPSRSLTVSSTGGVLNFTAASASTGNWLQVTPATANTQGTLSVSVTPQNLNPGTYTGTVTITAAGASNSPQTRTVTLTVSAAPALTVSPAALSFLYRTDGAVPGSQTLAISSTLSGLQYTVARNATWIQVSPPRGTVPGSLSVSVNPAGLGPGQHSGTITVSSGTDGTAPISITVTLTISAPLPTITGVTNAASYLDGPVAPGEIVTLFGTSMGPAELTQMQLDGAGRVTTTLGDVRVLFNGVPAPLVYVSATQISAVVPYAVAGETVVSAWVEYRGVRSNALTLDATAARPGVFTMDSSGSGPGVILNQDYSVNSASKPAARGTVVVVYCTGEGQTLPAGVDGRVNDNFDALPKPVLRVEARIGNQVANVQYAGAAPGMVSGVMQVNVEIPATAASGVQPLVLTVGGVTSQPNVTVAVQ